MDGIQFDAITKLLAARLSRRTTVRGLAATALAAGVSRLGTDEIAAKKRRCRKLGQKCKLKNGKQGNCCGGAKCRGQRCQERKTERTPRRPDCPGDKLTRCGLTCVNTDIDPANCGRCGRSCGDVPIAHPCVAGFCVSAWGSHGSGDGEFDVPIGVAIAPNGDVYIAEWVNHRIQQFTATGSFIRTWGSEGSGNGEFVNPDGVAVAPDGDVYVADSGNGRIQQFTGTGSFIRTWGSKGSALGQFDVPGGIAVAPNGNVYIADGRNHRIQRFNPA